MLSLRPSLRIQLFSQVLMFALHWTKRLEGESQDNSITLKYRRFGNESKADSSWNRGRKRTKELGAPISHSSGQRPFRSEARSCGNAQRAECPKIGSSLRCRSLVFRSACDD